MGPTLSPPTLIVAKVRWYLSLPRRSIVTRPLLSNCWSRTVAHSARRRLRVHFAKSPLYGVSKPMRRIFSPSRQMVSPSTTHVTRLLWPQSRQAA